MKAATTESFSGSAATPAVLSPAGSRKRLVIVPAYNEADSIAHVIADLRRHAPGFDVAIIDDGSVDGTAAVARRAAAELGANNVYVISLPFNQGIGGAMQTGYRFAAQRGYDVAVQVDGDGQHPAHQIVPLVARLEQGGANMVIGSRFVQRSTDPDAYVPPPTRMTGIRFLRGLLRVLTGERITDCTSGFRAADRPLIESFARWYPDDYPEPEVIVLMHKAGFKAVEAPVIMSARVAGQTSIPLHRGVFYVVKVSTALLLDMFRKPWPRARGGTS